MLPKKAGAILPPTVNVDFNNSGTVDDAIEQS